MLAKRSTVFCSIVVFIAVLVVGGVASVSAQDAVPEKPSAAPVRAVTNEYYGVKVTDPYRYMENMKAPEVQAWMKAQNDYTRALLTEIPGREALLKRVIELDNSAPATVTSVTETLRGRYFYLKARAGENTAKLYMRDGRNGAEKLLVDPDSLKGADGAPHAINYYVASNDGRYAAYGESAGGSENATLRVFDTQTMRDTGEAIDRARFGVVNWLPGDKSFVYNRLQKLGVNSSPLEMYEKNVTWLHTVGDSPDHDVAIFGYGLSMNAPVGVDDLAFVEIDPASKYALGLLAHGVQNEVTLYSAPVAALSQPNIPWEKVCDVQDDVTNAAIRGDDIYLLTHQDTPRFRIVRTSLASPDVAHAQVVIAQQSGVLEQPVAHADALYVPELDGGVFRLLRLPYGSTSAKRVQLPFDGTVGLENSDSRLPGIIFSMSSWVKGPRILAYDPKTNAVNNTGLRPEGPFDNPADLTSVEVKAPSYDGTMIPLSIVYKKGIALDGAHPTILEAYGAYGITLDPNFTPIYLAWIERGGILAIGHVRGGGEYGEDWHYAGYKLTKANTWRDTIACGEYLIKNKYTSTAKIAPLGVSAGGITVGRTITERPGLFGAAIIAVGELNTVRSEEFANGLPNIPEFGSVKTQEGFEDLFQMDSYLHVRDGAAYPAVMLTTGINDPRVASWMPAKMTARLQAATSSGKPILLYVDYEAGHGFGSTRKQREVQFADEATFLLWQFGDPAFQPKP